MVFWHLFLPWDENIAWHPRINLFNYLQKISMFPYGHRMLSGERDKFNKSMHTSKTSSFKHLFHEQKQVTLLPL